MTAAWDDDLLPSDLAMDAEPLSSADLDAVGDATPETLAELAASGAPTASRIVGFQIVDDDVAEWAGRKLAETRREVAELTARADAYRAKIDDWFSRAVRRGQRTEAFFESRLAAYGLAVRADSGERRKSVDLPSVRIVTRGPAAGRPPVRVGEIRDPQRLYDLLAAHDALTAPSAGSDGDDVEYVPVAVLSPKIDKRALGLVSRFVEGAGGWCLVVGDEVVDCVELVEVVPTATVETP